QKERAYIDSVIDSLTHLGVITEEQAQQIKADAAKAAEAASAGQTIKKPAWHETVKINGYTQVRWMYYPDVAASEPNNEFLVRRSCVTVQANPDERSTAKVQIDVGEGEVVVKDAWLQYALGGEGEWRLRFGQQQVPFMYENLTSANQLISLERNLLARNATLGVRDTGLALMWTPKRDAELFSRLNSEEGAGDYGTAAVGLWSGQGLNNPESNDHKHLTLRYSKPFSFAGDRCAEVGASYLTGRYTSAIGSQDFSEHLFGVHLYAPARPYGFLGELYTGQTEGDHVHGFSAMGLWRPTDEGLTFLRYDEYNGPRRGKGLGNIYNRDRWSVGYAHQLSRAMELTGEYDFIDTATGSEDTFGLQLQLSY
ncbi:MAG: porin, partial [Candidatus Zipacnadales bacterium]